MSVTCLTSKNALSPNTPKSCPRIARHFWKYSYTAGLCGISFSRKKSAYRTPASSAILTAAATLPGRSSAARPRCSARIWPDRTPYWIQISSGSLEAWKMTRPAAVLIRRSCDVHFKAARIRVNRAAMRIVFFCEFCVFHYRIFVRGVMKE